MVIFGVFIGACLRDKGEAESHAGQTLSRKVDSDGGLLTLSRWGTLGLTLYQRESLRPFVSLCLLAFTKNILPTVLRKGGDRFSLRSIIPQREGLLLSVIFSCIIKGVLEEAATISFVCPPRDIPSTHRCTRTRMHTRSHAKQQRIPDIHKNLAVWLILRQS